MCPHWLLQDCPPPPAKGPEILSRHNVSLASMDSSDIKRHQATAVLKHLVAQVFHVAFEQSKSSTRRKTLLQQTRHQMQILNNVVCIQKTLKLSELPLSSFRFFSALSFALCGHIWENWTATAMVVIHLYLSKRKGSKNR